MRSKGRDAIGYERRSKATVLGLPLLHVVSGRDPFTGKRRVACGVVAVGQLAVGVVAICQLGAGVVAVSQLAVGALFGLGQFIVAPAAAGQFAVAVLGAVGQFACAWLAVGQLAAGFGPVVVGQSALQLGAGQASAALAWTPAVLAWIVAARALHGLGRDQPRVRHARDLPRLAPCAVAELQPGERLLKARVAPGQGVLFDATELTPVPVHRARLSVPRFVVEDDSGKAMVLASDAEPFVAGRGRKVALEEGDTVEILGTVRETPHAGGKLTDYRRPPTRWTIEATTVVAHQTAATVRAMVRFPSLLAWPMAVAALVTTVAAGGGGAGAVRLVSPRRYLGTGPSG